MARPVPSLGTPPPAFVGFGPPLVGAIFLFLRGASWPAWLVLLGAVMVVAILELVAVLTRSGVSRRPELAPVAEAGVAVARLVSLGVSSLESMLAVAIGLAMPELIPAVVAAGLILVLASVVAGVRRISAALAAVRAAGHGDQVKGYGPFIYRNKDDPRLWVPKLSSVGHTLNFAHPMSWLILAALLALPALVVVTVLLAIPR